MREKERDGETEGEDHGMEIQEVYVIESARYWQIVSQQIIGNANGRGRSVIVG